MSLSGSSIGVSQPGHMHHEPPLVDSGFADIGHRYTGCMSETKPKCYRDECAEETHVDDPSSDIRSSNPILNTQETVGVAEWPIRPARDHAEAP
jgi:hypothetical protein